MLRNLSDTQRFGKKKMMNFLKICAKNFPQAARPATLGGMKSGTKIERALAEKGWSQSELARRADSTSPSISRIVNGGEPSAGLALRIARALAVPVDWLIDDARDWPPPAVDSGHGVADCHDTAIAFKRRIERVYGAVQTAFEALTTAMRSDDREAAATHARRLVDACAAHGDAIDEWYRFAASWSRINVYAGPMPTWADATQIEAMIGDLLAIDPSRLPPSLRRWLIDCAEHGGATAAQPASSSGPR